MDPENLPVSDPSKMDFGGDKTKAWKDIWGCGQGIGAVDGIVGAAELVDRLAREYEQARQRLAACGPSAPGGGTAGGCAPPALPSGLPGQLPTTVMRSSSLGSYGALLAMYSATTSSSPGP